MREHEVPTHVQAEDRVLLWFTFPQIVAITAVCAISYGAYRYAPVGPSEVRMALAVLLGLAGIAAVVGKIGGRKLPLVAADLLKYRLGARVHIGPVSQLLRSEPPAPVQPARGGPGPLRMMAARSRRALRRLRKKKRREKDRRNGRMPFRPHGWFGKRRQKANRHRPGHSAETVEIRNQSRWRGWIAVVAVVVVTAAATLPQPALADDHEPWRDEIDFEVTEPVDGRRIFVEGLTVSGDRAAVTLRAATNIYLRARAYGGPGGDWLRFWGSARLVQGERIDYSLPLHGPVPSFTFSWEDGLGQAGALTIEHEQIPYPLPLVEGELCNVSLSSLGWMTGAVQGTVESECAVRVEEPVDLQTVGGHTEVTQTALMEAEVTTIAGTVSAATGESHSSVTFVPDGETSFSLSVAEGEALHGVTVDLALEASLRIPIPPLTQLTHHPERTEYRTETVSLLRPGTTRTVSKTVTVTHDDGTTTEHVVSATLSIPSKTVRRSVTLTIVHPERVESETVVREPIVKTREENLSLASRRGLGRTLCVPGPAGAGARGTARRSITRKWSCAACSNSSDGSGPGEAGNDHADSRRRRSRLHRSRAGRGSHASRLRQGAHGDGLRRLRPLLLRRRLGGLHPDGRGRRGARRRTRQDRRRDGGGRSRTGALGQGRRSAAEQRPRPILPIPIEQRRRPP